MAGFYVGVGAASGLKDETTQAATRKSSQTQPLDQAWLARFREVAYALPASAAVQTDAEIRRCDPRSRQFQTEDQFAQPTLVGAMTTSSRKISALKPVTGSRGTRARYYPLGLKMIGDLKPDVRFAGEVLSKARPVRSSR